MSPNQSPTIIWFSGIVWDIKAWSQSSMVSDFKKDNID